MIAAVTGASGHVGGVLVRALLERGHRVRVLVRGEAPSLDGLDVERAPGDLRDGASLARAFTGADVVVHAAAHISLLRTDTRHVEEVNVAGTAAVLAACRSAGVGRLVHFSSIHALEQRPLDRPVDEDRPACDEHPARGLPPYDRSKAAGERLVREAAAAGLAAVILYPTGIVGPYDFKPSLFGRVLRALALGRLPALIDGGFDWVDVRDVAAAAVKAAERLLDGGERPAGGRDADGAGRYLLPGRWASLAEVAAMVDGPHRRARAPLGGAALGRPYRGALLHRGRARLRTPAPVHGRLPRRPGEQSPGKRNPRRGGPRSPAPAARRHGARHRALAARVRREPRRSAVSAQTLFTVVTAVWTGIAAATFVGLFFQNAPYGRHAKTTWGPVVGDTLGWVLMELPSPLIFATWFALGSHGFAAVPVVFFALWEAHYVHRSFIYPFMLRSGRTRRMTLAVALMGFFFNGVNATLNGWFLFHLAAPRPLAWLLDVRFIVGLALFVGGYVVNRWSDAILRELRRPGESVYRIPYGGLYRWVSSPNYLGEIVEWIGWAVLTWSFAGASFAAWTAANLVPRARANHRWYRATFAEYPRARKALVPFVG